MDFSLTRRDNTLVKIVSGVAVELPAPRNISYLWNFGSLLLSVLLSQLVTGLVLAMNYQGRLAGSFYSVDMITREIWGGWGLRYLHICGASMFFLFLYGHVGRGIYFCSFGLINTWKRGVTILLLAMASAFFGYVLPWGQMSYWGATVITKFFSVIPYVGLPLVKWIWGRFSVDYPTLRRFYALHYLFPFILLIVVLLHIYFLHETGSKNPLGLFSPKDKITFYPYFLSKDLIGIILIPGTLFLCFFTFPGSFMEYQNFIEANPLVTPPHIQPEWYFLAAYAVLRCIPSKLGGVVALGLFVGLLYILPIVGPRPSWERKKFYYRAFWVFSANFIFLTWLGACPVEAPFIMLRQVGSFVYFGFYILCYGIRSSQI